MEYKYSEHHNSLDSDTFHVILVLYSSTLSLKKCNDSETEVSGRLSALICSFHIGWNILKL